MYCPHCGRTMAVIDGVFTCVEGDMPLSQVMQVRLSERYPDHRPRPVGVEVGRRITRWFCPSCGVPLGHELVCGACGRSLQGVHYHLVELHPHRDI